MPVRTQTSSTDVWSVDLQVSLLSDYSFPAPRVGRSHPNDWGPIIFSWMMSGASLHFGKITLHFPNLQGETGSNPTASATTQSPESLITETL
jgi:hypothetical protein